MSTGSTYNENVERNNSGSIDGKILIGINDNLRDSKKINEKLIKILEKIDTKLNIKESLKAKEEGSKEEEKKEDKNLAYEERLKKIEQTYSPENNASLLSKFFPEAHKKLLGYFEQKQTNELNKEMPLEAKQAEEDKQKLEAEKKRTSIEPTTVVGSTPAETIKAELDKVEQEKNKLNTPTRKEAVKPIEVVLTDINQNVLDKLKDALDGLGCQNGGGVGGGLSIPPIQTKQVPRGEPMERGYTEPVVPRLYGPTIDVNTEPVKKATEIPKTSKPPDGTPSLESARQIKQVKEIAPKELTSAEAVPESKVPDVKRFKPGEVVEGKFTELKAGSAEAISTLGRVGEVVSKVLKIAGPLAALYGGVVEGKEEYKNDKNLGKAVTTGTGAAAGAFGGAEAGALGGAALGSMIPLVGTVIGGIAGGLLGGYAGEKGGAYIAKKVYEAVSTPGKPVNAEASLTNVSKKEESNKQKTDQELTQIESAKNGPASNIAPIPLEGLGVRNDERVPGWNKELIDEFRELNKVIKDSYQSGGGVLSSNSTNQSNTSIVNVNANSNPISDSRNLTANRVKDYRGAA
jgi:hypothetical protein